jgi:hypothetical protein
MHCGVNRYRRSNWQQAAAAQPHRSICCYQAGGQQRLAGSSSSMCRSSRSSEAACTNALLNCRVAGVTLAGLRQGVIGRAAAGGVHTLVAGASAL